jgi:uncharacterized phage infection (PIP) family protein YhgE
MDKYFFPDVSDEQRLDLLKTNCNRLLEDYGYEKPLSKEQVKQLKDKIANHVSELRKVKAEKKEVVKDYNSQISTLEKSIDSSSDELEKRTTYTSELCFEFIDYDEKKVGIYNRDGLLISERPANLKELREPRNMFTDNLKTGTNN